MSVHLGRSWTSSFSGFAMIASKALFDGSKSNVSTIELPGFGTQAISPYGGWARKRSRHSRILL
jgi:hypothetical protein